MREIWDDFLQRLGGPFLFGAFSIADAFYAPVITRFRTDGLDAGPAAPWAETVWNRSAMREWVEMAREE